MHKLEYFDIFLNFPCPSSYFWRINMTNQQSPNTPYDRIKPTTIWPRYLRLCLWRYGRTLGLGKISNWWWAATLFVGTVSSIFRHRALIPTCHFFERFLFRMIFIQTCFYYERPFLRTVIIFLWSENLLIRRVLIPKISIPKGHCYERFFFSSIGLYCEISVK